MIKFGKICRNLLNNLEKAAIINRYSQFYRVRKTLRRNFFELFDVPETEKGHELLRDRGGNESCL